MVGLPPARVLEIQRMSTEDGPGIRTTVFFKGCSLACDWCHNPESVATRPQIVWHADRCLGCRGCLEVCPHQAARLDGEGRHVDPSLCATCGACVEECPTLALELLGRDWPIPELVSEVLKDQAYYETSGGGVTASGGDPTMQARAVGAFLESCRDQGVHVALDTAGLCASERLLELATHADLVLFDLKLMDPVQHRAHTGQDNERILHNLVALAGQLGPRELWIRTPLVPGVTATEANVRAIGAFLSAHLGPVVSRWELCAFNNLAADKYRRLGSTWAYEGQPLMSRAQLDHLGGVARASGVDPHIVHVTGAASAQEAT